MEESTVYVDNGVFFSHKNEVTGFTGYEVIERNHNESIKSISERQVSHFPLTLCRKLKPVCAFDVEEKVKLSKTKETCRRQEGWEGQEKQGPRSAGGRRSMYNVCLLETSKKKLVVREVEVQMGVMGVSAADNGQFRRGPAMQPRLRGGEDGTGD